ncbi:MAG: sugar phosphate nucleotidyltransferase [bacterium]
MLKDAILLVAGKGHRLKPLTDGAPKPLTEINGKTILGNALESLAAAGVERVHLVTGYLNEKIMHYAKAQNPGIALREIYSPLYETTNNMYSLWLAREVMTRGCLLLEGDVFFGRDILKQVHSVRYDRSYWFADIFSPKMNGCMLTTDGNGLIQCLEIVRTQNVEDYTNKFKSIGILAITANLGKKIVRWLEEDIEIGRTDVYYDLVLQGRLKNAGLHILDISGRKWAEIDDFDDLRAAEELFA